MARSGRGTRDASSSCVDLARARRDRKARDRRLLRHVPLALEVAHRYAAPWGLQEVALVGIANVGLVKALSSYDASSSVAFADHAEPLIVAEIEHYLGSERPRLDGIAHSPSRDTKIVAARKQIAAAMSRQDHVQELASYLSLDVDTLVDGLLDAIERDDNLLGDPKLRGAA
jgi:DNA-directed RNA polymerase specialized sigma subunit